MNDKLGLINGYPSVIIMSPACCPEKHCKIDLLIVHKSISDMPLKDMNRPWLPSYTLLRVTFNARLEEKYNRINRSIVALSMGVTGGLCLSHPCREQIARKDHYLKEFPRLPIFNLWRHTCNSVNLNTPVGWHCQALDTGQIQILVLTNCPDNWYWNWYWLIKNIEKLLFFHLNIFPSTFCCNFWYSMIF